MSDVIPHGKPHRHSSFWHRLLSFILVFAIVASLAVTLRGRIFGTDIGSNSGADTTAETTIESASQSVSASSSTTDDGAITPGKNGSFAINTASLCKATGYAGPVPVKIYVSNGRIDSVSPLPNAESPEFFAQLTEQGLIRAFDGKTLDEAARLTPDAASGATFSSRAFIENVKAGAAKGIELRDAKGKEADAGIAATGGSGYDGMSASMIAAMIVLLTGMVIPLFLKSKRYRIIQDLLNVGVLGFWSGTFIDYAMLIGVTANGIAASAAAIVTILLLIVGFIYPLFGKTGYYCGHVCPFGSLQNLAGLCCRKKIRMSVRLVKALDLCRMIIWAVLLIFLWLGFFTQWIDHEIFTAFMVKTASPTVIVTGILFTLLALVIPRPFCRFLCPTGTLLRLELK